MKQPQRQLKPDRSTAARTRAKQLHCPHCERTFRGAQGMAAHLRHAHQSKPVAATPVITTADPGAVATFEAELNGGSNARAQLLALADQLTRRRALVTAELTRIDPLAEEGTRIDAQLAAVDVALKAFPS
jgi:hypothetical protein